MLDRYGNEIIISDELKEVINNIKELPKDKLDVGLSLLSYTFPLNIIYFGYLNNCYDLKEMKMIEEFFNCSYVNYKNYDDYIKFFNNILDKMGLTEKVYNEHKECIKNSKKMLDIYIKGRKMVDAPIIYSLETRVGFANIDRYFDNFTPYEVNEYINDRNYYLATLNFESNTEYQILDQYVYKKYKEEYKNTDNEALLIFNSIYVNILKDYKYSIETTEENQVLVFLEGVKKEEMDYLDFASDDEEDKIIIFTNNISVMLELANKLSNYFCDNEMKFRSMLDE